MQQRSKWWDEEAKEPIREKREAHARYASNKTTAGWEEHVIARKKGKDSE